MEIEKAFNLFSQNHYSGAAEQLSILMERVPDPALRQRLRFVCLLARAYEAWDALEFDKAYEKMDLLIRQLKRDEQTHRNYILMDCIPKLERQAKILSVMTGIQTLAKTDQMEILLNRESVTALMFTIFQHALVREKQEKYDMATLLLYRLLEMVEQKRLANLNLNVSNVDYDRISYEQCGLSQIAALSPEKRREWLSLEFTRIRKSLFGKAGKALLPMKLSLLDGYCILLALEDPICTCGALSGEVKLKRIRAMVSLRNNSIFAHGIGPVGASEFARFRDFVVTVFREFCDLEHLDFAEIAESVRWIDPAESGNYRFMEF